MDVRIPHQMGRDEAKRRIAAGLPKLAEHIPGGGSLASEWTGPYDLALTIKALGATVPVRLAIEDDAIVGRLDIPMLLKPMSAQIAGFVETSATKMLGKPAA